MRKLLIFLIFSMLSACGANIAKVNGERIPTQEFVQRLKMIAPQNDVVWLKQPGRAQAFKEKLLNTMIDETLLLQEAKRLKVGASDEELAEEYARYKSQYTEEGFQKMLAAKGVSYSDWKEERRRNYIIDKLREAAAPDAGKISDAELKAFYTQNIKDFQRPEEVHARQILVGKDSTAKMIHDKLVAGDNFAALAQQYSISPDARNGGDIGSFARGTFPAVFDKVCFSLPIGGISDVVKSDYGYQIFKVIDHQPARTVPFPEAKKIILRSLKQDGGQKQFDNLLAQLRQDAKITMDAKQLAKIEVPHETDATDSDSH